MNASNDPRPPHRKILSFLGASGFRNILLVVGIYGVLLVELALYLPQERFLALFSESGPFETLSYVFWIVLGFACFLIPGLPHRPWQQGVVALLAAAREADLHRAFTGTSILKTSYYLKFPAPLSEKLIAALIAIATISLVLYVLIGGGRLIVRTRAWSLPWGRTALLAAALLVATKMLDRVEAVTAEWFGFVFPTILHRLVAAFEEGYECLLPLLFIAVLLQYRRYVRQAETPDLRTAG